MGIRLKQLLRGRMVRFYLVLLVLFLGSIGLFYLIANLRGAAAWERAQERLESEGEVFGYDDLFEDPVADADNFFGTPALLDVAMVDGGYPCGRAGSRISQGGGSLQAVVDRTRSER